MPKFRVVFNDPAIKSVTVTADTWKCESLLIVFYNNKVPVAGINQQAIAYISDIAMEV